VPASLDFGPLAEVFLSAAAGGVEGLETSGGGGLPAGRLGGPLPLPRPHNADQAALPRRHLAAAEVRADLVGGGGEPVGAEAEAFAAAPVGQAVAAEIAAGLAAARLDQAEAAGAGGFAEVGVIFLIRHRGSLEQRPPNQNHSVIARTPAEAGGRSNPGPRRLRMDCFPRPSPGSQ